jgi:protein-disulfide isomerase
MSRKTKRNAPPPGGSAPDRTEAKTAAGRSRWILVGAAIAIAVLAVLFVTGRGGHGGGPAAGAPGADGPDPARAAALASAHAPSLGEPTAKVHVVEFLDPACETCAAFFPIVKQLMAENPGKIRLSTRHVAFHEGAEYAVRVLEASRAQDRYWQTLEALLGTQAFWAPNHTVRADLVDQAIADVGLDPARLRADVQSAAVTERIEKDRADAIALQVTATPEYFVNGKGMPSFGEAQLRQLIAEALRAEYP